MIRSLGLVALLASPAGTAFADDEDDPTGFAGFLDRHGLSLEGDIEWIAEDANGEGSADLTFDEVGLTWAREWIESSAGVAWSTDGSPVL